MGVNKDSIAAEMLKKGLVQFPSDAVPHFEQVHVGDMLRASLLDPKSRMLHSYLVLSSGQLTKRSANSGTLELPGPTRYSVRYDTALLLVIGQTVCAALDKTVFEKAESVWGSRVVHGSAYYSTFMVISAVNGSWNISDDELPIQGRVFSLPWVHFVRGHDKITIERE